MRPPSRATIAVTAAIAGAAGIGEAAQVPPVPAINHYVGEVVSFLGDRAGDVVEVGQDAIENPPVDIHENGGVEHTTWWGQKIKEGQGVFAAVAIVGLLGYALRRRKSH